MEFKEKILILSGPVHSGKTTALQQWILKTSNVGGILTPLVNQYRVLVDIKTNKKYKFEVKHQNSLGYLNIGKYQFREKTFDIGRQVLLSCLDSPPDLCVIDEIGFLELVGIGFEPMVKRIIHHYTEKVTSGKKLILVIRDFLLSPTIENYQLKDFKIIPLQILSS